MAEEKKTVTGSVLDWALFRRVLNLASPFKRMFISASVLAVVLAVLTPLRPYIIQQTVDNNILSQTGLGLVTMVILFLVFLIFESTFRYFLIYTTNDLGQSIIKKLRIDVFDHLLSLRLRFFDKTPIGTATTRTITDVEAINNIFSQGLITIIADLLTILTVIIFMFAMDWRLTLITLIVFPIILYATYIFKESIKVTFQNVRARISELNAFLQEHITGMSLVQIFTAEDREYEKFESINNAYKKANIQAIWYYSIFFPVVEVLLAAATALIVWYGAGRAVRGESEIGVLIAFILFANMLFRPLRQLADRFNTLQMGMVASERVFSILDRTDKIENTGTHAPENLKGEIEFKNVWFAYDGVNNVIKDLSFSMAEGETMAIVGPTGAGKSSIINILNRFYPIQKGSIEIDGVDAKEYELSALRNHIGLVLQDVFLFSGSIYDNITLRNPQISREKVIEASKIVGADAFINKLPGKYDYNVMERGATLSVGQRQLISFIRALVFDPRILILDEATSSVDTESEELIQKAIEKLVKGRTSIVIAHRLSTIQNADKILVLDAGEIAEEGTHTELLEMNGHYRELHDMQFAEKVES